MTKDMTTGNPLKIIILFSIPVLFGNLFQQFYNISDTIIVGQFLGENALAAVGSTGSIMFLVLGFAIGIAQGFGGAALMSVNTALIRLIYPQRQLGRGVFIKAQ